MATPKAVADSGIGIMQRLGINNGGYCGETVDIDSLLDRVESCAHQHGWEVEAPQVSNGERLVALRRRHRQPAARVYISAGIHGDEPAGPSAVCNLIAQNTWPAEIEVWICPCLNPAGFRLNRRGNADGIDLNRDYRDPQADETRAHVAWLERQPAFDLTLCLHEDWEAHGFYLYELKLDQGPSLADGIIQSVAEVSPIDPSSDIEGWPAEGGILRPPFRPDERPQWPEAFYLAVHKSPRSYTLETPSDFPLPVRVAAMERGVQAALEELSRDRSSRS